MFLAQTSVNMRSAIFLHSSAHTSKEYPRTFSMNRSSTSMFSSQTGVRCWRSVDVCVLNEPLPLSFSRTGLSCFQGPMRGLLHELTLEKSKWGTDKRKLQVPTVNCRCWVRWMSSTSWDDGKRKWDGQQAGKVYMWEMDKKMNTEWFDWIWGEIKREHVMSWGAIKQGELKWWSKLYVGNCKHRNSDSIEKMMWSQWIKMGNNGKARGWQRKAIRWNDMGKKTGIGKDAKLQKSNSCKMNAEKSEIPKPNGEAKGGSFQKETDRTHEPECSHFI